MGRRGRDRSNVTLKAPPKPTKPPKITTNNKTKYKCFCGSPLVKFGSRKFNYLRCTNIECNAWLVGDHIIWGSKGNYVAFVGEGGGSNYQP